MINKLFCPPAQHSFQLSSPGLFTILSSETNDISNRSIPHISTNPCIMHQSMVKFNPKDRETKEKEEENE